MKNFLKQQENIIKDYIKECGYEIDEVELLVSSNQT